MSRVLDWRSISVDAVKDVRLTKESLSLVDSYKLVSSLETGAYAYEIGAPQALTRLMALRHGKRTREDTPLLLRDFSSRGAKFAAQEAVDQGALAPLNLSMNRLQTVLDWPSGSRGAVRIAVLRKIRDEYHPDLQHWLGKLQFAILAAHPRQITNRETHKRYWVNWAGSEMTDWKGWEDVVVCVSWHGGGERLVRL